MCVYRGLLIASRGDTGKKYIASRARALPPSLRKKSCQIWARRGGRRKSKYFHHVRKQGEEEKGLKVQKILAKKLRGKFAKCAKFVPLLALFFSGLRIILSQLFSNNGRLCGKRWEEGILLFRRWHLWIKAEEGLSLLCIFFFSEEATSQTHRGCLPRQGVDTMKKTIPFSFPKSLEFETRRAAFLSESVVVRR